jgi:LuxR family maltose regulon positive regulatory protein
MPTSFVTTKLYIPSLRLSLVPRPRLLQKLDEGLHMGRRLTLISTPAGYGKTTLVSAWLHGADWLSTWLSLIAAG